MISKKTIVKPAMTFMMAKNNFNKDLHERFKKDPIV